MDPQYNFLSVDDSLVTTGPTRSQCHTGVGFLDQIQEADRSFFGSGTEENLTDTVGYETPDKQNAPKAPLMQRVQSMLTMQNAFIAAAVLVVLIGILQMTNVRRAAKTARGTVARGVQRAAGLGGRVLRQGTGLVGRGAAGAVELADRGVVEGADLVRSGVAEGADLIRSGVVDVADDLISVGEIGADVLEGTGQTAAELLGDDETIRSLFR